MRVTLSCLRIVSGVNYNVNSNYTKYLNCAADFFCVLENFRRKFANFVAQPADGTANRLERCKAHQISAVRNAVLETEIFCR